MITFTLECLALNLFTGEEYQVLDSCYPLADILGLSSLNQ